MYDPSNWHWLADDGRLFSSAKIALIQSSDTDYVAWRAQGHAPTRWPQDVAGQQTTAAMQDVLTPYGLFADIKSYAASVRYAKEISGTVVNGQRYPSDRDSQAKLTSAALFAQVDSTQTFKWKLADGTFTGALTAAQMVTVAATIGGFVNGCFATEAQVLAGVDAGTITTKAQVNAAFA